MVGDVAGCRDGPGRFPCTIGIDNCTIRHDWLQNEIEKIATLANLIGMLISRELTLAALQGSERRFRAVSETVQDGIILIDGGGTVGYWNAAAERILGYTEREATGRNVHEFLAPQRFRAKAAIGMKEFGTTGQGAVLGETLELAAMRKDGVEIPVELSVAALRLDDKWHSVATIRDISERRLAEQQLSHMAHHDSLTGLANRPVFVEALRQAIARAERGKTHCAVLYLDLDHFKDVNDTLGHPTGDLLLQMVGRRLREAVRESDTVARFGGDEFAIIEEDVHDPADAAILSDKLVKLLGQPLSIDGNEIHSGASIGVAVYGMDAADPETLLSHADVALYRAKAEGRGTYRFFTDAMDVEVRARVLLDNDMRKALLAGEFFLMYQPQIEIETNRIIGLEALLRWQHPTRGLIAPSEFIPVAERNGLIVAMGSWVLHEATRQTREWLDSGMAVPLMAVNVSALQFKTPLALEHDVALVLAEAGLSPGTLELELTEGVLMEATQEHSAVLVQLREAGARLAIDDFGTGYSSLEYLARLPIDRIKIAQNFMIGLSAGSANAKIVRAAIGLAGDLGLNVVVEGVETAEQLDLVKSWGGRAVQGYYYSKPLSVADTAAILRVGKIIPAPTADNSAPDPLAPAEGPRHA